jgi:hypothetical protein
MLVTVPAAFGQNGSNKADSASAIDTAFRKFWAADSRASAAKLVDNVIKTGVTFDEAVKRLKQGRAYTAQQSGVIQLHNRTSDGVEHFFAVNIPPNYDPARRYQVRFQLHGGIGGRSDNKPRGNGQIGNLAGSEQIYVLPYAWNDAPWWGDDQVLNLTTIVDELKRTYNVDENRVAVAGVSDGATGAYFIAMKDTTPYASFLPLNGFIMVLSNSEIDDGKIFPNNLLNKPFFVVNGGRDRLYPTSNVEPYTKHLMGSGVKIDYHPQPNGEHNTAWWPDLKDTFEKFVIDHPREPHPDRVTWQTANAVAHGRAHWLVIDQLGTAAEEAKLLPDVNSVSKSGSLFEGQKPSGRVDLVRTGNSVQATTKGVSEFTLLISPDQFDFSQPVKVIANGREVFNARISRDVKTLLKWAAQDNDRTMLYGAEVKIKLPK